MANIPINFIGGAYTARSTDLNSQVCQNFYVEIDKTGSKNPIALIGHPGMKAWGTSGIVGEVRNFIIHDGYMYAVIKNTVYRVTTAAAFTSIGTIGTNSGWADMNSDGVYLSIFDATGGWTWDGATFAAIALPVTPYGSTYQDGYHIIGRLNSGQFFLSDQDDPTTFDAINFADAEGDGDNLVSPVSVQRQLWLIGERTSEVWYNSGETFPFTRNPGGFMRVGCSSKRSIATLNDELMFLDDKGRVVQKQGLQLVPVSTYQIDFMVSGYTKPDSVGFMYHLEGHTFYELSFPTDNKTICYDLTTQLWSTKASGNPSIRSFANCAIRYDDKVLVGHYDNGNIYEYDLDTYQDAGERKEAIRTGQVVSQNREWIFFNSFELDMETTVDGSSQIALDYSDDGGKNFSAQRFKSIGSGYSKRVRWNRLGRSRNRVFRATITDNVKRNIINAYVDGQ